MATKKKKDEQIEPVMYKLWDAESNVEDILKDYADRLTIHERNMLEGAYNVLIAVDRSYVNRNPISNK